MKRLLAFAILAAASGASAADRLLSPNWSSADVQRFLRDKSRMSLELQPFSLPVLGLQLGTTAKSNKGNLRVTGLKGSPNSWPSCADNPKISLAADGSRSWFSRQYDFGCIQIAVGGDRHADDREASPIGGQSTEQQQVSVVDENSDPNAVSSIRIDFVRYNIPYHVAIDCADAAKSFCGDAENVKKVAASLIVEGGSPR